MKAASFVIGILVGMVLLVVAVGGGLAVALSVVTVGQIEDTVGTDIIDDASDANNNTLLDLATDLIKDFGDPSSLTINLFREKYGLKIPAEISGIDISVLFDYPISEVANHLGDVVNNMTLRDVDEFLSLGLEEKYPDLSVLISNLDNNVDDALNNILASIDSSSMTLYSLETGFGITLGENALFDELYHTPMSQFGGVLDYLPVGTLTGADSDLFLPLGENKVFVAVDRYEEVTGNELAADGVDGADTYIADGAETYIAGAGKKGLERRELLYTRGEDGSYTPDNSCYAEDYDGTGTFYRHIVYEPYDGTQEGELSVKAYLNNFTADGKALVADGLFPLSSVYTDESLSVSLAKKVTEETVTDGTVTVGEAVFINIAADVFINIAAEGEAASPAPAALFGLPEGATADENPRLEEKKDGVSYTADHDHIRVHIGTSDQAIQVIAGIGVSSLNNVTDKITSLKLGEVIDITDDSAKILRTLKDTAINKLSDALDTIALKDATDIVLDEYSPAADGAYVLEDGSYTLYNPTKHEGAQRYQKTVVEGSSSAALQRLANVSIPNISAAFDTMVLGDAIGVTPDTYILVDSPERGETYYVFNELGYPERAVYGVDEADAWYERVSSGEGNAILKQLAFVGINDISEAMNGVIEDTLLSDIIEIVRETAVKADEATGKRSATPSSTTARAPISALPISTPPRRTPSCPKARQCISSTRRLRTRPISSRIRLRCRMSSSARRTASTTTIPLLPPITRRRTQIPRPGRTSPTNASPQTRAIRAPRARPSTPTGARVRGCTSSSSQPMSATTRKTPHIGAANYSSNSRTATPSPPRTPRAKPSITTTSEAALTPPRSPLRPRPLSSG